MSARAFSSEASGVAYYAYDSDPDYGDEAFYSGERVCAPPSRDGGNTLLRVYAAFLLALGFGAAIYFRLPASGFTLLNEMQASVSRTADNGPSQAIAPAAPLPPQARLSDASQYTAQSVPDAAAAPVLPQVTVVAEPPTVAEAAPTPSTAAKTADADADAVDSYRKRAEAIGLDPGLSRVLLKRLSAADFRNAAVAIEAALKSADETKETVWPRKAKPGVALFTVHFVKGAEAGCRRYVVTVTKDRWTTTAAPMEKCGSQTSVRG